MSIFFLFYCVILSSIVSPSAAAAIGESIPYVHKSSQKILSVEVACSEGVVLGRVFLNEPFHGILYALGFPEECRTLGNGTKEVRLAFTSDRCGTKVSQQLDGRPHYEAVVYLQFDRKMQQGSDETILLKCSPADLVVRGGMSPGVVQKVTAPPPTQAPNRIHDSWMDILFGKMPSAIPIIKPVHVGEDLTMLIKVRHTAELASKVVDCKANDGSDESQQQLIDTNGCTVDADIIPNLKEKHTIKSGIKMVYATFKAFKFPMRKNLHLRCRVIICNGTCPTDNCNKSQWSVRRRARDVRENVMDRFIEEMTVFNSVEVLDILDVEPAKKVSKTATYKEISGGLGTPEEILCLTSTRMVVLFAFLLGVLLVSLVVTICTCVKARELRRRLMQRQSSTYYGRVSQCS